MRHHPNIDGQVWSETSKSSWNVDHNCEKGQEYCSGSCDWWDLDRCLDGWYIEMGSHATRIVRRCWCRSSKSCREPCGKVTRNQSWQSRRWCWELFSEIRACYRRSLQYADRPTSCLWEDGESHPWQSHMNFFPLHGIQTHRYVAAWRLNSRDCLIQSCVSVCQGSR